jgi:hypothetical protein
MTGWCFACALFIWSNLPWPTETTAGKGPSKYRYDKRRQDGPAYQAREPSLVPPRVSVLRQDRLVWGGVRQKLWSLRLMHRNKFAHECSRSVVVNWDRFFVYDQAYWSRDVSERPPIVGWGGGDI